MSRPFANNNGKTTFAQIQKTLNTSDYIHQKKIKSSFCNVTECSPNNRYNFGSQGNYLNMKNVNYYALNPHYYINKTQLYINLFTKLNLSDVIVVSELNGNNYPVQINTSVDPYLLYDIDPSGNLFGNTVCGINNFENYIEYNGTI